MTATGFHEGELAIQRRAGVEADAKRLERMLDSAHLSAGAARFLALQTFSAVTGRDRNGILMDLTTSGAGGVPARGRQSVASVDRSARG